jgi:hypothetical protein
MPSYANYNFEERLFVAKKIGLFDYSDPTYREQINFDRQIPDYSLLKDVFFRCIVPPKAGEDPAGSKIAVGVWNGRGAFIGRADGSGDCEIGGMIPGKQWHAPIENYGPCLASSAGRGVWVRKDYFFRGSGLSNIQLNMSLLPLSLPHDNEDFELDICFLCLCLV